MLMFGLRLGTDSRVVVTTTPKPIKIIRELIADPTTAITRGSTYDNRAMGDERRRLTQQEPGDHQWREGD
jgi:phage terminase large subunit-like protein